MIGALDKERILTIAAQSRTGHHVRRLNMAHRQRLQNHTNVCCQRHVEGDVHVASPVDPVWQDGGAMLVERVARSIKGHGPNFMPDERRGAYDGGADAGTGPGMPCRGLQAHRPQRPRLEPGARDSTSEWASNGSVLTTSPAERQGAGQACIRTATVPRPGAGDL
jgi:hypothetical protein